MSALDGYPLQEILAPGVDQELKDWVAIKYFRVLWRQIFEFGMLHTDPHPGNYLVTHHPRLCMLDFGSVRVFSEADPCRVSRASRARAFSTTTRRRPPTRSWVSGSSTAMTIRRRCCASCGSSSSRCWSTVAGTRASTARSTRAMEVASIGFEHRIFKSPGHRVFLGRALLGLESYVQQLGTVANWHRLFREFRRGAPPAARELTSTPAAPLRLTSTPWPRRRAPAPAAATSTDDAQRLRRKINVAPCCCMSKRPRKLMPRSAVEKAVVVDHHRVDVTHHHVADRHRVER